VGIHRDKDEERAARIDALVEEHRVRHESTAAYTKRLREAARASITKAKAELDQVRKRTGGRGK
jgi:hypothetical protein